MFTNVTEVQTITGIEVTNTDISRAQYIIESFVGRNESEIHGADDVALMAKAVAFQAVYMKENYETVYEQVALVQFGQMDSQMTLDTKMAAPYVAPLAVLTVKNLSWRRSRSFKTGRMFSHPMPTRWETT